MSRIRSVHPGLWTDERFMEVSPLARLLLIGIWTECDDKGSFEWSPIKLKARLLPVDNCDVPALLEELAAAGSVMRYEVGGRKLGAVRNFTRFQRPKKPNDLYPQPPEVRNYCAGEGREVPNQLPTDGENSAQMEEGGGRMEIVGGDTREPAREQTPDPDPPLPTDLIGLTEEVCRAAGIRHVDPGPILRHQKLVQGWLDEGFDPEADIFPAVRAGIATATERINSLSYFDRDIRQTRARREAGNEHVGHDQPVNPMLAAVLAKRRAADRSGSDEHPVRLPGRAGGRVG